MLRTVEIDMKLIQQPMIMLIVEVNMLYEYPGAVFLLTKN
jgi:hypothetical protein